MNGDPSEWRLKNVKNQHIETQDFFNEFIPEFERSAVLTEILKTLRQVYGEELSLK